MHWKTLDLDPAHATEREVKRAYARRLKGCRPDQDPEGFKALHDAYQAALGELEWRSHPGTVPEAGPNDRLETGATLSGEDSPADASAAVYEEVLSPEAAAVLEVLERLEKALIENHPGVGPLARETEKALFQNPGEAVRWGNFVANLIHQHGKRPDLRFHPEVLVIELEHHCLAATFAVIDRLDQTGNRGHIEALAMRMLEHQDRIRNAAGGIAAARLACVAAFWCDECVGLLADFAYANLARGERDFYMGHIDRHLAIGRLLTTVPESHADFWRQRLIDNSGQEGWETEAARSALHWLFSSAGGGNAAAEVLRGLVPENAAGDRILPSSSETSGGGRTFPWEAKKAPRPQPVSGREMRAPHGGGRRSQEKTPVDLGFLRFLILPVIYLAIKMATMSSGTRSSYEPSFLEFDSGAPAVSGVPSGREGLTSLEQLLKENSRHQDWQRDHPPVTGSKPPGPAPSGIPETNPLFQQFKAGSGETK